MRNYELMFITPTTLKEEELANIRKKITTLIEEKNGVVLNVEDMGKKKFAYEIKKIKEGMYTLIVFKAMASIISELERFLRLNDKVLRHLIVNIDEKIAIENKESLKEKKSISKPNNTEETIDVAAEER